MEILNLFPTVVYKEQIEIPSSVSAAAKKEKYSRNGHNNGWLSATEKHLDNNYKLLVEIIDDHVKLYMDHLKIEHELKCCGAWMNVHTGTDWAQEHYHQNAMVSGIVYLEAPNGSGPIVFHPDKHLSFMFGPFFPITDEYHMFKVDVKTGMILLFPSTLSHSVYKNTKNVARCSFAFDYMIKGKISTFLNETTISS